MIPTVREISLNYGIIKLDANGFHRDLKVNGETIIKDIMAPPAGMQQVFIGCGRDVDTCGAAVDT